MIPRKLSDNEKIKPYLMWLGDLLMMRGNSDLSIIVAKAEAFSSGPWAEFLIEAKKSLSLVKKRHGGILNKDEVRELISVIKLIDGALKRSGLIRRDEE